MNNFDKEKVQTFWKDQPIILVTLFCFDTQFRMLFFVNVVDSGVLQTVEQGHFFQIIALKNPARKTWQHIWCPHCLDFPSSIPLSLLFLFLSMFPWWSDVFYHYKQNQNNAAYRKVNKTLRWLSFFIFIALLTYHLRDYDFQKSYLKSYSLSWATLYTYVAAKHFGLNDIRNGTYYSQ